MLIYSDQISERLVYTLDFVFHVRGLAYELSEDPDYFDNYTGPKLNYSNRNFENEHLQLAPGDLMFHEEPIIYALKKDVFFNGETLNIGNVCDPLAAIFFVLTRAEEYTSSLKDNHGRFAAEFSILKKHGWLHFPICDIWAISFLEWISENLEITFDIQIPEPQIIPTFDIDNAFAYKHKTVLRRVLSLAKDAIYGNRHRIAERNSVLRDQMADPYDTFETILSIAKEFPVRVFWLLGNFGKYDKNLPHYSTTQKKLIQKLAQSVQLGLHPSYQSNGNEYFLQQEKKRIEKILRRPVKNSRQHFLKLEFPKTYRRLIKNGFTDDYTMGFADDYGFRMGTAHAVKWFDLEENKRTDLTLHPFVYMDGTFNEYLELSPELAKRSIGELYDSIKKYGGDFICIWHNETIGDYKIWEGWKSVLEYTLNLKHE